MRSSLRAQAFSILITLLALPFALYGQDVTTDKLDYKPGETAYASGTGWFPNENIVLNVHEEPVMHPDVVTNTTSDASGNFTNVAIYNFDASDYGSSFILTATGETSGLKTRAATAEDTIK